MIGLLVVLLILWALFIRETPIKSLDVHPANFPKPSFDPN